jgi:hypothetical protein
MNSKVIKDLNFVGLGRKIRRGSLSFMSIGIFSISGKIFLAYSHNMFTVLALSVYSMQAKTLLAYSETTS